MPRQGILPRAAVHFVIETTLGWNEAVFGNVVRGSCLADLIEIPTSAGARRAPEAVRQSHALADCLQADQWGGASDPATFNLNLAKACRRVSTTTPDLSAPQLERVRVALREFGAQWRPLVSGGSVERTFTPARAAE